MIMERRWKMFKNIFKIEKAVLVGLERGFMLF